RRHGDGRRRRASRLRGLRLEPGPVAGIRVPYSGPPAAGCDADGVRLRDHQRPDWATESSVLAVAIWRRARVGESKDGARKPEDYEPPPQPLVRREGPKRIRRLARQ